MLVSFTVQNFRSIYEPVTIDLVRNRQSKKISQIGTGEDFLPVFGIYGANASGKSTLLKAFRFLWDFVVGSAGIQNKGDKIWGYEPFAFADKASNEPSSFVVEFIADAVLYEYALAFNADCIVYEHLYSWPRGRRTKVFEREGQEFTFLVAESERQQRPLAERTLENRPYLYTSNEWNLSLTEAPFMWFRTVPIFDLNGKGWRAPAFNDLDNPEKKMKILQELKYADFGISDIIKKPDGENERIEIPLEKLDPELRIAMGIPGSVIGKGSIIFGSTNPQKIQTVHCINGKTVQFSFEKESDGTSKYLSLMSGILLALEEGKVLMIDEFESSPHPLLVRRIVELFQDPKRNTAKGQLIFVSHNTTLLDLNLLEQCQIGFVEKDPDSGATELYTLEDIKGVRNSENIAKGYLQGRYGAVPFLA